MVIVSHDREFLDQLCTKIVETERGVSATFKGGCAGVVGRAAPERCGSGLSEHVAGGGNWCHCVLGAQLPALVWLHPAMSWTANCGLLCLMPLPCPALLVFVHAAPLPPAPSRQLHRVCEAEGGGRRAAVGGVGEAAEGDFAPGAVQGRPQE